MEPTFRVLVVDDLPHWAEVVQDYARHFPCEVRHTPNLTGAQREVAQWRPHIILLDLHMARDAWPPTRALQKNYNLAQKSLAFCEQVTSHPHLSQVIVVITSVEDQAEQKAAGLAARAYQYFMKADFGVAHFETLLNEAGKRSVSPAYPSKLDLVQLS